MTNYIHNHSFLILGLFLGLLAFFLALIFQDIFWSVIALVFLFLILNLSRASKNEEMKWSVLKIVLIPLIVGSATPIYSPFGNISFAVIVPIFGFMTLLVLIHNTQFKTNFHFTVAFIFLFSLAVGALSGIGRFMSDLYLGTNYLVGNDYLMIELMVIMVLGLLGSLVFILYIRRCHDKGTYNFIPAQLRTGRKFKPGYSKSHFYKILNDYFWCKEERSLLLTSKVLQIGLLALLFYNLGTRNFWGYSVALPSFVFSIFPSLYSRFFKVKVSPAFQFWISMALFTYAAGETLRFQTLFGWWNAFTHFMAGIIFGALIFIYLRYLDDTSINLHIPTRMLPVLVLTFILSISVLWEGFEFLVDIFFGTSLQPHLTNTIVDMIANTIGAFFTLLIANRFTPFDVFSGSDKKTERQVTSSELFSYRSDIPIFVFGFLSGILSLTFTLIRMDFVWTILGLIFLVLIFGLAKITKREKIKWDLVMWSMIPLFLGASGLSRAIQSYVVVGDLAIAAILPFLSLIVIFNLVYHTSFKTNIYFTVFLMFIFSLGLGFMLSIVRVLSDMYFHTNYLIGNYHMIRELLIITIFSIVGVGIFIILQKVYYLKDADFGLLNSLITKGRLDYNQPKKIFIEILNLFSGKKVHHYFSQVMKLFPVAIVLLTIYGIYKSNFQVIAIALPATGFSIIPYFKKHKIKRDHLTDFHFWLSFILFLLLFGQVLKIHFDFQLWILITRVVVGLILTLSIFIGFLFINRIFEPLQIPCWLTPMLSLIGVLCFVLAENFIVFSIDTLFETSLLDNLSDIVFKTISVILGGILSLFLIKYHM